MASKALLVLCVLLAIALLVPSEVAEKHDEKKVGGIPTYTGPPQYGGNHPGGGRGNPDGRSGYNRAGHPGHGR